MDKWINEKYITSLIGPKRDYSVVNGNITITNNYISQNRYGFAADNVDGLKVRNNVFIQRFNDKQTRKFWTNNDILIQNTKRINWGKN